MAMSRMLFYVDYLALCAQDHHFFHRFVAEWDAGSSSVLLLPNWAFSLALAHFQQELKSGAGCFMCSYSLGW